MSLQWWISVIPQPGLLKKMKLIQTSLQFYPTIVFRIPLFSEYYAEIQNSIAGQSSKSHEKIFKRINDLQSSKYL